MISGVINQGFWKGHNLRVILLTDRHANKHASMVEEKY